jgi:hypothetical protein
MGHHRYVVVQSFLVAWHHQPMVMGVLEMARNLHCHCLERQLEVIPIYHLGMMVAVAQQSFHHCQVNQVAEIHRLAGKVKHPYQILTEKCGLSLKVKGMPIVVIKGACRKGEEYKQN